MTKDELKLLRELAEDSTKVVGWYAHGGGDRCELHEATVRGPFGRWLKISDVGEKYRHEVALAEDDAKFAAAAMNNLVPLLDYVEELKTNIEFLNRQLTEAYSE